MAANFQGGSCGGWCGYRQTDTGFRFAMGPFSKDPRDYPFSYPSFPAFVNATSAARAG